MTNLWRNISRHWQDDITVLLGAWLIVSPWVLGFAGTQAAVWNAVLAGVFILLISLAALTRFEEWEEWLDMAIGLWLIASPWALGFASLGAGVEMATAAATWNVVLAGLATVIMSGWSVRSHRFADGTAH